METKAICIEPNYPGTKLYEVGNQADLSEIPYELRYCWEIGGVSLADIKELDDKRFYLVKLPKGDVAVVGKKMKAEIDAEKTKNTSLEAELAGLKLKLAKAEGAAAKKEKPTVSKEKGEKPAIESEIF